MTALALDPPIVRRALVTGRVVDATAGTPPRAQVSIRIDRLGVTVRMGTDGLFALSGRELAGDVTLSLAAHRYAPRSVLVPIAPGAAFPIDAGTIELQPLPVRLEGRVTREVDRTPLTNVEITIDKKDKLLLLRTPLSRPHANGTEVAIRTLTVTGTGRTLLSAVPSGSRTFLLDDATGLAPDDVLKFGAREYGVIESATTSDVTLTHALRRSHPAGTSVAPVILGPIAATTTTRRDTLPGDALLPVTDEAEGRGAAIGNPPEYHDLGVTPDGDGYFAVDGIRGERALTLVACGLRTPTTIIDYGKDVNRVSLRLKKKGDEPCLNT